jgi:predicted permease
VPEWLVRFILRARATMSRGHDRELRHEIELHLQLLEEQYIAQGMSPDLARQRARGDFGNATVVQETSHDLFAFRLTEDVMRDVRHAVREMRRHAGFTCVAVASLAIGIGAVTAAFTIIDAFLLRPLPVRSPEELVAFSSDDGRSWGSWPYAHFTRWRDAPDAALELAASSDVQMHEGRPDGRGEPREVRVSLVSGNYFRVVGAEVARGRALLEGDATLAGAGGVAVISDAFWDRWFGRVPGVLTRTLELRGVRYQVVGVIRAGFTGHAVGHPSDVWIPLTRQPELAPDVSGLLADRWGTGPGWLKVIGRLKPGVSVEQAAASVNLIHRRFVTDKGAALGTNSPALARERQRVISLPSAAMGDAPERRQYTRPLLIVLGITGIVLLVACANFTNLTLARSESRRREFMIRLALGGGRSRLIRQSATECVVLAALAGILGLLFAVWTTTAAMKQLGGLIMPVEFTLSFDARILAFAAACVVVVIAFGLWPSTRPVRSALSSPMHQAATALGPVAARGIGRRLLLVIQLALCTVVLVGAGLLVRTVINLRSQDLGVDRSVLLVSLSPLRRGYAEDAAEMFLQRVRDRLLTLPGVKAVGVMGPTLMDSTNYWIAGSQELTTGRGVAVAGGRWTFADVGPGFFEAVGMSVEGRNFDARDAHPAANVVAINRTLATLLFAGRSPLGERIRTNPRAPWQTVIGVVNDVKQTSPRDQGMGVVYLPMRGFRHTVLVVRTAGPPAAAADAVREQLGSLAPEMPIEKIRTLDEVLDSAIAQERLMSTVALFLAGLAIALGCVGLYAVMAYDVAQRTRELGVRYALGATSGNVVAMVLREGALLVLAGLAAGVPLGVAASRTLSPQLYGVKSTDPWTLASVALLLTAVALLGTFRPARTASRIDPIALLRNE